MPMAAAECVAVIAGGHDGDDSPSRTSASLWNSIGSGSVSWNCTSRRPSPFLAFAQDGVAADEIGFLRAHGKAEAGLQHVVLVGDVMAEMAEGLFDAAAVERVQAAELQVVVRSRLGQRLEHMRRLVGRDVKLPAQLAHVGDAVRAREAHADLDLARGAEGKASLVRSSGLQSCRRLRAFGPMTQNTASAAVMSVIVTKRSPRWARSHARSRCSVAPGTTSRKAVSESRVTVRSLSMPPRAFSIWV
jgi:hypothetical protein